MKNSKVTNILGMLQLLYNFRHYVSSISIDVLPKCSWQQLHIVANDYELVNHFCPAMNMSKIK